MAQYAISYTIFYYATITMMPYQNMNFKQALIDIYIFNFSGFTKQFELDRSVIMDRVILILSKIRLQKKFLEKKVN